MQLSADRAGLVLAGDLVAAVRAMVRLSPEPAAETFDESGELATFLLERDGSGGLVRELLAVRVAALIAFWLTRAFASLVSALVE
jgi:hypothetical protein